MANKALPKTAPAAAAQKPPVPKRPTPAGPGHTELGFDPKNPTFEPADWDGDEHRKFPRARIHVPFSLWIEEGGHKRFSATLSSWNLSVSGAFMESTFFLPIGTRLRVSFKLDDNEPAIEGSAEIIRQERPDPRNGQGRSGFAIKFVEFFAQTEVALAKLFLGEQLRSFAQMYMGSKRAQSQRNEFDRVVDALAAWELQKVTTSVDIWQK